ncbi:nucleotide pyrophosphohydrolase [Streptomyces rishiriensis]|uniref:NTP pyrophosphatase (Non-canonical NTP hydrolase) n=1 Tax=Streptomyces rishiriensis TaxID=68264 RepID=A0ABU0NFQ5_STRRH|nr:nucleotide pyrophosphohydrolase [Streptomyces rishiriensis]MDQ0577929.1 NTP pyrophosphatase (non-canonical NTP hydrolase) [Streptomyces rishiriensis]
MTLISLQRALAQFAVEREWEQFHTPKNLVMALAGESGELVEIFQWLTPEESAHVMQDDERAVQVREELADVLAYLLRLADVLNIDLEHALAEKIEKNRHKYPVHLARGKADKYTQLGG